MLTGLSWSVPRSRDCGIGTHDYAELCRVGYVGVAIVDFIDLKTQYERLREPINARI